MRHAEVVSAHALVARLPGAQYPLYYPLSRVQRERRAEFFRRLPHRGSNLVQELAHTLNLPVLTVCRAVSRMSAHVFQYRNAKILQNAKLCTELGVSPADMVRSLYVLRMPGPLIRRREAECRRRGLPLRPFYLGLTEAEFQRRLAEGGPLPEHTSDVAAFVARRLGVSVQLVRERIEHMYWPRSLTAARFEEVTALLEAAGYRGEELQRPEAVGEQERHRRPERKVKRPDGEDERLDGEGEQPEQEGARPDGEEERRDGEGHQPEPEGGRLEGEGQRPEQERERLEREKGRLGREEERHGWEWMEVGLEDGTATELESADGDDCRVNSHEDGKGDLDVSSN
ncbi:neurofilament medium polypeptide-like [Pollicipes pollicipes]|uniref:neurofilament medium polypeptide-like n=1 Tax=Pollicipes pollicipes TaxID=41117 RepID=UPI00188563E9|nr:neurofilament medium polypeptide-like [Pollicipes pollicipes]